PFARRSPAPSGPSPSGLRAAPSGAPLGRRTARVSRRAWTGSRPAASSSPGPRRFPAAPSAALPQPPPPSPPPTTPPPPPWPPAPLRHEGEPGPGSLSCFPLRGSDPPTSLLGWTDALWKLLGTTAVLVGAELTYVTVQYRRRGESERLVTVASSLDRLQAWLP